jgi:Zinc knuckle
VLNHSQIDTFVQESDLSYRAWELAVNRFLDLLELNFPVDAAVWRSFYAENFFGGKIQDDRWQIMLEYDCSLCREMLPGHGCVPDMDYIHFMALAEGNALVKARKSILAEATKIVESRMSSFPSRPSQGSSRDTGGGHSSFQGGQREVAAKTAKPERAKKCFACSESGHWADDCKAATQKNGQDILIKRGINGKWVLPNGSKFCFTFNGEGRCRKSPCNYGTHLCTLCGLADHGAFFCPTSA